MKILEAPMTAHSADRLPDSSAARAQATASPGGLGMLLAFPAFVLLVTLAVVVVGSTDAWAVLAGAMLTVAALTAVVSVMTARLLADD
jgi:hypothetical protein